MADIPVRRPEIISDDPERKIDFLSKRERRVCAILGESAKNEKPLTDKEMARVLRKSPYTIKNQIINSSRKLGVKNRSELIFFILSNAKYFGAEFVPRKEKKNDMLPPPDNERDHYKEMEVLIQSLTLSKAEKKICFFFASSTKPCLLTAKGVGRNFGIAPSTARNHLSSIYKKMRIKGNRELERLTKSYPDLFNAQAQARDASTLDIKLSDNKTPVLKSACAVQPSFPVMGGESEKLREEMLAWRDAGKKVATLTPKEMKVCQTIFHNPWCENKEISQLLNISNNTLRNHLTTVYDKIGVKKKGSLFQFMFQHREFFNLDKQQPISGVSAPEC